MTTQVGLSFGLEPEAPPRSPLSGTWVASATPVDSTRTGFDTDTVLPEFGGAAAPERTDAVQTSLTLTVSVATVTGTYTDEQGLTCALTGTYDSGTGAVALSGQCGDWTIDIAASYTGTTLTGVDPTGGITIARDAGGASSETRDWTASRGAAVAASSSAYFIDSRAGDDGTAVVGDPSHPFATELGARTARGGAWADGDDIRFARGTYLREAIDARTGVSTGLSVTAYGVGPRPILDGSDIVSAGSWSAEGTANVYQATFDPDWDDTGGIIIAQDGIPLLPVADIATCSATEGSFVIQVVTGAGPYTIYAHRRGNGAPVGDELEVTSRGGVFTRGSSTIRSITARLALGESGGIVNQESIGSGAETPVIEDCWALSCEKHSLMVHAAGMRYCVAVGSIPAGHETYAFVLYRRDGDNTTATFTDCAFYQWPQLRDSLSADAGPIIVHRSISGGSGDYGTVIFDRFGAGGQSQGSSLGHGVDFRLEDCIHELPRASNPGTRFVNASVTWSIRRCRFYAHNVGDTPSMSHLAGGSLTLEDNLFTTSGSDLGIVSGTGTYFAKRNHFVELDDIGQSNGFRSVGGTGIMLTMGSDVGDGNVFYEMNRGWRLDVSTGELQASDWNVVTSGAMLVRESISTTLRAFSTYQGDQATLDQNSSISTPDYEVEANAERPRRIETAASAASRGWAVGPTQARPGGDGWTDPETYLAARAFVDSL